MSAESAKPVPMIAQPMIAQPSLLNYIDQLIVLEYPDGTTVSGQLKSIDYEGWVEIKTSRGTRMMQSRTAREVIIL